MSQRSEPVRALVAYIAGLAFAVMVLESIDVTHPGLFENRHIGAQCVLLVAALVFGSIVGWGCSR